MSAGMVGADADALDAAAAQLDAAADELDNSARVLASSLGSLSWLGAVAIRFTDLWTSNHSPAIVRTAGFIRESAVQLREQASQQRTASSADGGGQGSWGPGFQVVPSIPDGMLPDGVRRWWASLTPEQQRALIERFPDRIGNLDGVPFTVRFEANRLYMQGLLDSEQSPDGPIHKRLQQFTDGSGRIDPTRNIVVFDPSGDGKVAEVIGNIDTAKHVAVVVPGLNSTMDNFGNVRGNATALQGSAGSDTAVIAWTGYDAPNVWQVGSNGSAVAGAHALSSFVDGIQGQSGANVSLIGHSYGSLVVGEALKSGTVHVDNAVFIGSPGVGVNSVHGFPEGAANHYYAGEIPGDPIAQLGYFGKSPTDSGFDADVFNAGEGGNLLHRHSQYFDNGPGLDNLKQIVNGGTPTGGTAHATLGNTAAGAVDAAKEIGAKVGDAASDVARGVGRAASTAAHAVADGAKKVGDVLTFWN